MLVDIVIPVNNMQERGGGRIVCILGDVPNCMLCSGSINLSQNASGFVSLTFININVSELEEHYVLYEDYHRD